MTSADDGCPSTVVKRGKMCVYERERGGEVEVIGQSRTEFWNKKCTTVKFYNNHSVPKLTHNFLRFNQKSVLAKVSWEEVDNKSIFFSIVALF